MTTDFDSKDNTPHDGSCMQRGSQEEWSCCPAGELQKMVDRMNVMQRCADRKRNCYCGAVAALLVACLFLGGTWMTMNSGAHGGMTCTECKSHFADYRAHLTGDSLLEDETLIKLMSTHLEHCPSCRAKFMASYPDILAGKSSRISVRAMTMLAMELVPQMRADKGACSGSILPGS